MPCRLTEHFNRPELPRRFGDPQGRTDPHDGDSREHHAERELEALHPGSLPPPDEARQESLETGNGNALMEVVPKPSPAGTHVERQIN
jgi:hypothetical protein